MTELLVLTAEQPELRSDAIWLLDKHATHFADKDNPLPNSTIASRCSRRSLKSTITLSHTSVVAEEAAHHHRVFSLLSTARLYLSLEILSALIPHTFSFDALILYSFHCI